jgi:HSP20 family protein
VREEDTQVVVRLEAPGMEREDFDISVVQGRTLVVRGEKRVEREESRGRYHVIESAFGLFERVIALPVEVSDDGARARYRRGVLTVTLPKAGSESRRIEVKSK